MFDQIAARYDLLNRLMSFGLDRRWRRRLVQSLALSSPEAGAVLDIATGTADVAIAISAAHPEVQVVGLDPSTRMLQQGAAKIESLGLGERIRLVRGDALEMPFATGHFAASCISFGIRNVPDRLGCLREMRRVTRQDGVVAVLELCEPQRGFLSPLVRWHVRRIVPTLGSWLSRSAEYRYLQRSMAAFPPPDQFLQLMHDAGLARPQATAMGFGAVHLYRGTV
jgi:demethylmenaquinone methyltransferase/2-methoxy-6-polyprenyl-1,4-benzoquinol methylase